MVTAKFNELMEGARQMRDHVSGKKVDGIRVVTLPWDPADHLTSDEERLFYLEAAMEAGDPALLEAALRDIERSRLTCR